MIELFGTTILSALQQIFDQFGWFGVAAIMTFENATSLTPSEVTLGLAGWLLIAAHDYPTYLIVLGGLAAGTGSTIGASLAYWFARLGGRPAVERVARWLRIEPREIVRAENLFQHWGAGLVLFGRLIPGVRTLISLPAGLARMHFGKFLVATFAGATIWCSVMIGLGYTLGHEWQRMIEWVAQYALFAIPFAGALALAGLAWYWFRIRPQFALRRISDRD